MISALARRFFANSPVLGFAIIALVLFVLAFAAIIYRVARTDRDLLAQRSRLPLADEEASDG